MSEPNNNEQNAARKIRHIGYALFGGTALLIAILLGYISISGHYHNRVFDPFTGDAIESPDNH